MNGRKNCLVHLPEDIEIVTPDGVFIKGMMMEKEGTIVAQHSHTYAHTSLVARGSVRVWSGIDGDVKELGEFKAPAFVQILANVKHKFMSLEDNTAVYCIHNLAGEEDVSVAAKNSVEVDKCPSHT